MAQPTNTYSSYDANGNREDLTDDIYDISPRVTPFISMCGRSTAKNRFHQWQIETLAPPDTNNATIEGDDQTYDAVTPTTLVGNVLQISDKGFIVSETQEAIDHAGRASEVSHQAMKKGFELRRDMESIALNNQASVTGNDSTARKVGGLPAWPTSNAQRGATGANGGYSAGTVAAATDGTLRGLTQTMISTGITNGYELGAEFNIVMVSPRVKAGLSKFLFGSDARIASVSRETPERGQASAIAAVDFYESDFGPMDILPNRFQRPRDVWLLDPNYVELAYLRPFKEEEMPKSGDAYKRRMVCEWTLKVLNEAAIGVIADIDQAVAVSA